MIESMLADLFGTTPTVIHVFVMMGITISCIGHIVLDLLCLD